MGSQDYLKHLMKQIETLFAEAGIPVNKKQLEQFSQLLGLFKYHNAQLNLSAIRQDEDIIVKHFVDSLLPILYFDLEQSNTLFDIGSGGGFPGLPLGIFYPHLEVTINDAVEKKMHAVMSMAQDIGLSNVLTLPGRAEDIGRDSAHREQYDIVTARAVALMPIVLEYAAPLLKVGGKIILYKGETYQDEIVQSRRALDELHLEVESVHIAELPQNMGERAIIVFNKSAPISEEYPRRVGVPKKKPL